MDFLTVLPWLLSLGLFVMLVRIRKTLRPRLEKAFWKGIKLAYVVPDDAPNVAGELWMRTLSLRDKKGRGSGMAIDSQYGLTAYHVLFDKMGNFGETTAIFHHGLFPRQKIIFVAGDKDLDMALFKFETPLRDFLKPMLVSDEITKTVDDDEREVITSDIVMVLAPRPKGSVWLQGAFYYEKDVPDIAVLNFGKGEAEYSALPGDSGCVGLDLCGNIRTMIVSGPKRDDVEARVLCVSGGVPTPAIRTFLQTHWPNYRA